MLALGRPVSEALAADAERRALAGRLRQRVDHTRRDPSSVIESGVDIVEVERIAELLQRHGERFRRRVYTDREWDDSGGRAESLAARFAAKEAVIKALGSREPALVEIEVVRPSWSRPQIRLWGRAAEIAREQSVRQLSLSLSHTHEHAIAMVVLDRDGDPPAWEAEA